ncbi:hypothetical protein RIF29_27509 [Crotalaria pallida]|uniref:Uncharacterized protein n=1 Tax=Crotalaria pallida TaxID=3830 RepID=A0AAN9I135_CROPI
MIHNTSNLNSIKPTSINHSSSISLEPYNNLTMKNITQACKSPNTRDNDDDYYKGKGKAKVNDDSENGKVDQSGAKLEETGRERLKRHREEVMRNVNIPENWGQENLMKDWMDYSTFDGLFAPHRMIITARDALIEDVRKARSQRLRVYSS